MLKVSPCLCALPCCLFSSQPVFNSLLFFVLSVQSMTNMTTLLLLRRRSSVQLPRERCLATSNSSGNLANSTSSTNLSFTSASKQYVSFCVFWFQLTSFFSLTAYFHETRLEYLVWTLLIPFIFCEAAGKEEKSPAQGHGGGSGVPLSDNENSGAETRPQQSKGNGSRLLMALQHLQRMCMARICNYKKK